MVTLHDISIREGDMIAPCLEATNLSTSDKGTHSCAKFVIELKSGNAPANALLSSDLHSGSNSVASGEVQLSHECGTGRHGSPVHSAAMSMIA